MRVITSTPRVLYYIYHSLGTEDNLPAGWSYPDGGVLYKYVLDQNFAIISSTTVNTGGRYDPPATPEGDSVLNPNSGLELLISEVAVPEMANKGAIFSVIDYSRRVTPYYVCDADGNCKAIVSVESLSRELNVADVCTGPNDPLGGSKYSNTGRVGYTLQYQAERYLVEPDGNYTLTASSTGYTVSPMTQDFNKTVIVDNSQNTETLIDTIINPFPANDNLYDYTNDMVNNLPCNEYIYAGSQCAQAPITVNTPLTTWTFSAPSLDGIYKFYTSDEQSGYPGVTRWRIFNPAGQCVRFDAAKYVQMSGYVPDYGSFGATYLNNVSVSCPCSPSGDGLSCTCPTPDPSTCSCDEWANCGCGTFNDVSYSCPAPLSSAPPGQCGCDDSGNCGCTPGSLGCVDAKGNSLTINYGWTPGSVWVEGIGVRLWYPGGFGVVYAFDGTEICAGSEDFNEHINSQEFGRAEYMFAASGYNFLSCKNSCYQLCGGPWFNYMGWAYGSIWNYYQNW